MAAIIFDFDGTIADSFDYVADYLSREAGNEERESYEHLKGLSMLAMARRLGHAWWRLPRLFVEGRHKMARIVHRIKPYEGMPELIRKLHNEGHELFIVSSNSVGTLRKFLHHHKLHTYFLEFYGGVNIFGKTPALKKLIKENNLEPKNCVYVGDEVRDIEASKAAGIRVMAVSWGFADPEDLKDKKPTRIVDTPKELLAALQEI